MTPSYTEAEQYINHIQKFAKKNTLSHTRMYLQALGIDEETFAGRIIHVAGTVSYTHLTLPTTERV